MSEKEQAATPPAADDAPARVTERIRIDIDAMRAADAEAAALAALGEPVEDDDCRAQRLVLALTEGTFYGTLTQALDEIAEFHPPVVMEALFRGLVRREGEVACHLAAMLAFLHGKAESIFDWELRPLFLTFNTDDRTERAAACNALCTLIDIDPAHLDALLGS